MKTIKSIIITMALVALSITPSFADGSSGTSSGPSSGTSGTSSGHKETVGAPIDWASLEDSAREKLANLLANNAKPGEVATAAEVLDHVCRSRYLSVTSRLSEHIATVADGFNPQLSALPDLIKGMVSSTMRSSDYPPVAIQVVSQFLSARTKMDAQMATGDILCLIPALDARDKARLSVAQQPFEGKTPEEKAAITARNTKAANDAFDIAWKAGKTAAASTAPNTTAATPPVIVTLPAPK